jgi:hypothetical protein
MTDPSATSPPSARGRVHEAPMYRGEAELAGTARAPPA